MLLRRANYLATLCALLALVAACGSGSAGSTAHPASVIGQRAGLPAAMPAIRSPPVPAHPVRLNWPPSQAPGWAVPGTVIRNLDTAPGSPYRRGRKVVALTFDDGPSPVDTPQVLRILVTRKVLASFEIIGLNGAAYPGLLRAEHADGMSLVGHTWNHVNLIALPAWEWPGQVDRTDRLLQRITGHRVRCVRPPYGRTDPAVTAQLGQRGLANLEWDVDPSDYLRPGAMMIAKNVLAALHPGAIVVLHDGGGNRAQTVAALPAIISGIRAAGYQIVPVCGG